MKQNKSKNICTWLNILLIVITVLIVEFKADQSSASNVLTLSDVTQQAKKQNLLIKQKLIESHQSQMTVQYNRMSLLPKLNLFKLLGTGGSPMGVAGIIDEIAPFLIPANWFRVSESKISLEYQRKSYQALWGNEVLATRSLYLTLVSDLNAQAVYENYKKNLDDLQAIAETRDQFGGDQLGALEMLLAQKSKVAEDIVSLKDLINQQFYNLTQMVQLDPKVKYNLDLQTKIDSSWKYIQADNLISSIANRSPEVQSFDQLVIFLSYLKKETLFSFFGSSELSKGVAGGVFDDLPTNSGWGFNTKASLALNTAKKDLLRTQQLGVKETLKRQILRLIDQERLLTEKEQALIDRKAHLENQWEILLDRLQFGKNAAMDELIVNRQAYAETQIALININILRSQLNDKANRMLWWDAYGDFKSQF